MSHETHLDEHFTAGKTARVTLELRDDLTGAAIPGALIDALTMTLFNRRSGAFLPAAPATGARQNQDILGVNGGGISAAGVVTMELSAADMAIVGPTLSGEGHGAAGEGGGGGGGRRVWPWCPRPSRSRPTAPSSSGRTSASASPGRGGTRSGSACTTSRGRGRAGLAAHLPGVRGRPAEAGPAGDRDLPLRVALGGRRGRCGARWRSSRRAWSWRRPRRGPAARTTMRGGGARPSSRARGRPKGTRNPPRRP